MPMDKKRYPPNWKEIALKVKEDADWKCENCGMQCRRPGEPFDTHKRTLTVAHLNHTPEDCRRENLKAWCSACHLKYDAKHHAETRRRKRMKKLFISVPMKGRTEEAIKASMDKMQKIAEAMAGEYLIRLNNWIDGEPPKGCNPGIWYLGKSLKILSKADYFIGVDDPWRWSGCMIEDMAAQEYGINRFTVNSRVVAQDAVDALMASVEKEMQEMTSPAGD